jgi:predicted secreted hydrolase
MQKYSSSSYHRLYDESFGDLWSPEVGLSPGEDGDHYSPARDFFEWWYFDAAFDNGYRLVAILHSSLYNAVDHKPTLDLRVTPPGGASVTAIGRFSRREYRSAADHCDVRIGGCRASQEAPGRYRLQLKQGPLEADLHFQAAAPGWRPGNGCLFFDRETGHYFKWVVPLPLAAVSGTLRVGGEQMQVQGRGYHDHNWGNFVLADAFDHWYWGRFQASRPEENCALIFGDVHGRGPAPQVVRPFLLVAGGEILPGNPSLTVELEQDRLEPLTGVRYPTRLNLRAEAEAYTAALTLQTGRMLEALDFASSRFRRRLPRQLSETAFYLVYDKPFLGEAARRMLGKASYLRLEAQAQLTMELPQPVCLEGDAIYEIMQF